MRPQGLHPAYAPLERGAVAVGGGGSQLLGHFERCGSAAESDNLSLGDSLIPNKPPPPKGEQG